ncbi:ABC transporter ATP-binding protein [Bacteroides reticulotermitis JCM 10512]|uniref:ABC transporter ATP-binding protein n=1 Tax=Bacteroides reticulotermitis JCM 10512 TaxID=1445607 RepID=W4UPM8_9BACE|nr:ABC transporter ATP-binding protein [Bacteroides reticulotermitis JCM 10512]
MNRIHLQQTLPQVFADRNSVSSDVWHQDLTFRKGEMYLIEAASGTGKSSLCSYIYGYRNDYQGIINFDETNIKACSIKDWVELRKRSLSMLYQDLRIFSELTAFENIQLKNQLTGYKKKKEIQAFFETLGIADKLNVKAAKLSFGQQQRVAFIRALCQPFDFLFLDEPSAIWTMRTVESWANSLVPKLKSRVRESLSLLLVNILSYPITRFSGYNRKTAFPFASDSHSRYKPKRLVSSLNIYTA